MKASKARPGPTARKSTPRATVLAAAVVFVLTLAIFAGDVPKPFINFDDDIYITNNPAVQTGLTVTGARWAFPTLHGGVWIPTTWLSHQSDVSMFGMDAKKHHWANLSLHALNASLLLLLLEGLTGSLWRSAIVAAFFAWHPLRVESFAWACERKDVLSTTFWLLTTLMWVRTVRRPTTARCLLVVVLFVVGLMAKPMLVTLPFTLLLLDVWPLDRLPLRGAWDWAAAKRLVVEKLPLFAISFAWCFVAVFTERHGGAVKSMQKFPPAGRVANAIHSYVDYIGKTIWPTGLSIFYPYRQISLAGVSTIAAGLALVGLTAVVFTLRRRAPFLAVGCGTWERFFRSSGWCRSAAIEWRIGSPTCRPSACSS